MSFTDLLEKLDAAALRSHPYPHIYLEDFLDGDDFEAVVSSPDITLPAAGCVDEPSSVLGAASYRPVEFPGCTKSRAEYVAWLETALKPKNTHATCEGKGMALRCTSPKSEAVRSLDAFFRSPELGDLLTEKFGVTSPTQLDRGLEKYLNGYEISPHPDIRQKALTWMLNVNPGRYTAENEYHTHYMTFRPEWDLIREHRRDTSDAETWYLNLCSLINQRIKATETVHEFNVMGDMTFQCTGFLSPC